MKILIQMKTISTQIEIQSQPNPLTNSASTCSKRCSLPCSWPIVISAVVIFLLYLLYCPHKTTGQKNPYLRSVDLRIFWLAKQFAICSSLRTLLWSADFRILFLAKQFAKQIASYRCELKAIWHIFAMQFASQKVSQTVVLCDSTEMNLCRKKLEEKEGTYKCCFEVGNATLP